MCGRFSFSTTLKKIEADLDISLKAEESLENSYNIAPTQRAYIITSNTPHLLQPFYWGLVPAWAKDPKLSGQLINARSETVLSKSSFRQAVRQRRCWVPVDSFYEWKNTGAGKQPYRIMPTNGKMMCLAGIWETCIIDGKEIKTFSILTQAANEEMKTLHHRMPVILSSQEARDQWIGKLSEKELANFLNKDTSEHLRIYPVSPSVNSVRNNGAHLHKEYFPPPTLF